MTPDEEDKVEDKGAPMIPLHHSLLVRGTADCLKPVFVSSFTNVTGTVEEESFVISKKGF